MNKGLGDATERLSKSMDRVGESMEQVFLDMNSVFVETEKVFDDIDKVCEGALKSNGVSFKGKINGKAYDIRLGEGESLSIVGDDAGVTINGKRYTAEKGDDKKACETPCSDAAGTCVPECPHLKANQPVGWVEAFMRLFK